MSPEARRGPISPAEAKELKTEIIPDEVYLVFNALIAQNLYRGRASVKQDDVVGQLVEQGFDRAEIFSKHWLDIEDSYRASGWDVKYDSPAYNEDPYDPYFLFSERRQSDM